MTDSRQFDELSEQVHGTMPPTTGTARLSVVPDTADACDHAAELAGLTEENEQLRRAVPSRGVIGQAQGLLMAWLDIDADQAFAYLRRRSMADNRKLIDIAAEIVRTRQRPND